eukprot:6267040-Prymnesium_polylepis.1
MSVEASETNEYWFVGVLLDTVATLGGASGKQLLRHAAVTKNNWFIPLGLLCTAVIDPVSHSSATIRLLLLHFNFFPTLHADVRYIRLCVCCPISHCTNGWHGGGLECVARPFHARRSLVRLPRVVPHDAIPKARGIAHRDGHRMLWFFWQSLGAQPLGRSIPGALRAASCASGAWGGLLAGNMMTTKASVEMIKCEFTSCCLDTTS